MSSIDENALRALTDPLFDALTAQAAAAAPFPLGPDPALPSYYMQPAHGTMRREDFLAASCLDGEEFAERLAAHWQAAGRPELVAQAPRAAATARALHALYLEAQPQVEVSPYIYQMF